MAEFSCKDINGIDVTQFVFNDDGTVSGIITVQDTGVIVDSNTNPTTTTYSDTNAIYKSASGTTLSPISEECCNALNFIWDSSNSTCYWTESCEMNPDFKIVLGSKGNEGAFFQVEDNETCQLQVTFKYLLQFDCNTLSECTNSQQMIAQEFNDLTNEISKTENQINSFNITINELSSNLNETRQYCLNTTTSVETQIRNKETECENISNNIQILEDAKANSTSAAQIIAYQSQIDDLTTQQQVCQKELSDLYNELKLVENDCNSQIGRLESLIVSENTKLNETNNYLTSLQNEASLKSSVIPTCLSIFEGLDVAVTLDKLVPRDDVGGMASYETPQTFENIFTGDLFKIDSFVDFLDGNCNTGLYVTGSTSCLQNLEQCIIFNLSADCGVYSACSLNSDWQTYSFSITDEATLSAITNEHIKLGFLIRNCECDFNILIDRVEINKVCSEVENNNIYVSRCPKFELDRVIDNKKSWVATESKQEREFFVGQTETDYNINHHKLAINTKELDLEISPATAIETDMWCYIRDNEALLDVSTGDTSVSINTNVDFEAILSANTLGCDSNYTSACTLTTIWGINVNLECKEVYTNASFYSGTSLTEFPSELDYITELSGIATTLGLNFTTGSSEVIFTSIVPSSGLTFINNSFEVNLTLEVITDCNNKEFQDGDPFLFQDGTQYEFNI